MTVRRLDADQALLRARVDNLRWTAGLVNSRSASAATQRAALESIPRICFAARMASRFKRQLRSEERRVGKVCVIWRSGAGRGFRSGWRACAVALTVGVSALDLV